jgi:hypothetical protein
MAEESAATAVTALDLPIFLGSFGEDGEQEQVARALSQLLPSQSWTQA